MPLEILRGIEMKKRELQAPFLVIIYAKQLSSFFRIVIVLFIKVRSIRAFFGDQAGFKPSKVLSTEACFFSFLFAAFADTAR